MIALAIVYFGGNGGHKYTLVFQNAGQLVPDNEVMIGGSSVGTVDDIELTEDNLAEVHITIDQKLHEGSTAVIRATSLGGVANHYVSIHPGPNSNPELEDGAEIGLGSTTTPVDVDQLFNTFPRSVRRGLANFIKGNSTIYAGQAEAANRAYKYFGPALDRTRAWVAELNADERLLERFIVASSKLSNTIAGKGEELSSAIGNAATAFDAIARENRAFDATLQRLPQVMRQANTTFVNLRAALDDLEPLIDTAKPATKDLAPFLRELRPVFDRLLPFTRDLRLIVDKPGKGNDTADLLAAMPTVFRRASKAFPASERAIADFQPNLNFIRAYTPDLFNALGKIGQVAGYYDGNGHYVRAVTSMQNLFRYAGGTLEPIGRGEQLDAFGGSIPTRRRCPGGGAVPAPDGSNPWVGAGGVSAEECNPSDVPPAP